MTSSSTCDDGDPPITDSGAGERPIDAPPKGTGNLPRDAPPKGTGDLPRDAPPKGTDDLPRDAPPKGTGDLPRDAPPKGTAAGPRKPKRKGAGERPTAGNTPLAAKAGGIPWAVLANGLLAITSPCCEACSAFTYC